MAEWTRDTPWRQGSAVSLQDLQSAKVDVPDSHDGGLIITHDCDLANDIETEPVVEWLPFRYVDEADGNYLYAKNPRVVHLVGEQGGSKKYIELRATHKFGLSKEVLAAFVPTSLSLNPRNLQVLQGWLASRYRRHAFPDELVERLRPLSKFLENKLKKQARGVFGVWIDYDPRMPLMDEEPYEVWLSLVYTFDAVDSCERAEALAAELVTRYETAMPGIILSDCQAVSEEGFTLADQRRTVELKLEHLSHRIDPAGPFFE